MKKQNVKPIIGILGGMGPQASAHLVKLLVAKSTREFEAKNGDDFPEILLDSIPVKDFISTDTRADGSLEILKERVRFLNKIKPSCLAVACNTAHLFLDDLQIVSAAPFVSIIDEVASSVDKAKLKKVGILGSPRTIKSKLFQSALDKFNVECIEPNGRELKILERIIRKVIAGEISRGDNLKLVKIADSLKKRGIQGIILGCTELPLVFPKNFTIPTFDSLEILARALLRKCYK